MNGVFITSVLFSNEYFLNKGINDGAIAHHLGYLGEKKEYLHPLSKGSFMWEWRFSVDFTKLEGMLLQLYFLNIFLAYKNRIFGYITHFFWPIAIPDLVLF